ncbi:MAG: hypothetical protein ACRD0M_06895 [Acidimicrobiales bacterium]
MRWGRRAPATGNPAGTRTQGDPPSANGASSFHLFWDLAHPEPLCEVSAVLTVLDPPPARLYFWALQAGFFDGDRSLGAAHLGLQWHPSYPGSTAVNWGGYDAGGTVLGGSGSALPGALGDRNTRDYPWVVGRPYRLRIHAPPAPAGSWRGEVTDLSTGTAVVVRDLYPGGTHLAGPVVWAEVFARCDHPAVGARWSELSARTLAGGTVGPESLVANFQRFDDGGCDNTDIRVEGDAVVQVTNTPRRTPQGARIHLPSPAPP